MHISVVVGFLPGVSFSFVPTTHLLREPSLCSPASCPTLS